MDDEPDLRRSGVRFAVGVAVILAFVAGLAMPSSDAEAPRLEVEQQTVEGVTYRCLSSGSAMWCERIAVETS